MRAVRFGTVDHGQVVVYDGAGPIETAVNAITRVGTYSNYGFGDFQLRPIEEK